MPSRSSENVSRQNDLVSDDNDLHEILRENERMVPGLPQPVLHETGRVAIAKWKMKSAYYYLMFTSGICIGAILIGPSENVRLVALAIWGSATAIGGALLRLSYRKL
ncbi:MAG: hypothetical protein ACR2GH_17670 [Pseudonocardia sp.]